MPKPRAFNSNQIDKVAVANVAKLRKPGALMVRPGFEITGEQLTGRQAMVVIVDAKKKRSSLSPQDTLPDRIGYYSVDVREASAYQRLCISDPVNAVLAWGYERPEEREPEWPNEREVSTGKPVSTRTSAMQRALRTSVAVQSVASRALVALASRKTDQLTPAESSCSACVKAHREVETPELPEKVSPELGGFLRLGR